MKFPYPTTVIRLRWTYTLDDLGDLQRTGSPAAMPLEGCALAPRSSADITEPARQGVIIGLTLYAPLGTDLDRVTDQIQHGGDVWDIEGEVAIWRSPFSPLVDGLEVALRRAIG